MKNYRCLLLLVSALILIGFQSSQAFATTTKAQVVITNPTSSTMEVDGEGSLDKKTHFEFQVEPSKNGIIGHLSYEDDSTEIELESSQITFLSVTPPIAAFSGTANFNKQTVTFQVSVQDNSKSCQNDFFSITIKDVLGRTIYQKSGYLISGDIVIQNTKSKNDSMKCIVHGDGQIGKNISFHIDVKHDNSEISGSLDYQDKSAKIDLDSISITSLSETSIATATIHGTTKLNDKTGYTFEVDVAGNAKPAKQHDVFSIVIFDTTGKQIYTKLGTLTDGDTSVQ